MKLLNADNVRIVALSMKGKRREKFLASVTILNDSLAEGEWSAPRGAQKADSGFYQGIASRVEQGSNFELYMSLQYGQAPKDELEFSDEDFHRCGVLRHVGRAWVALCREKAAAVHELHTARPKPKKAAIGLSPKVAKTLTECNLDLDLASIEPAKIDSKLVPVLGKDGQPKMETVYFVVWSKGITHGQSRFAHTGGCEACGKHIPSGRFVAVEAHCKRRDKRVSLWLGCDCAKNIFGIRDVGLERK
jgi:hypothetical protein